MESPLVCLSPDGAGVVVFVEKWRFSLIMVETGGVAEKGEFERERLKAVDLRSKSEAMLFRFIKYKTKIYIRLIAKSE